MVAVFTGFMILTPLAGILLWMRRGTNTEDAGEFLERYHVLFNLLTHRGKPQLLKAKNGLLSVKIKMKNDTHILTLQELDERLVISWQQKSPEFGKASREWSFNPSYSQNKMYGEVLGDIREYQLSVMRARKTSQRKFSAARA